MKRSKTTTKRATAASSVPEFMGVAEVARLLACSEKSVRRYIDDGRLQANRIGGMIRISVDSYRRFAG
ncbi:MAG TPA: helix-turn-helix domain-containing protein [Dongiaceae bacterium]|nr:helix-turn-helix domain-containing protein [Dongiaceae bacterium]